MNASVSILKSPHTDVRKAIVSVEELVPCPGFGRIRDGPARILFALLAASRNPSRKWRVVLVFRDGFRDDLVVDGGAAYSNAVRIGYARVSGPTQDHQMQLDALADAGVAR